MYLIVTYPFPPAMPFGPPPTPIPETYPGCAGQGGESEIEEAVQATSRQMREEEVTDL